MTNAQRIVFRKPGDVGLEPVEIGEPAAGQVLVETLRTLISTGTELTGLSGDFPVGSRWADYMQYPVGAGYSNVGRVIRTGPEVESLQPGQVVASMAPHATHALVSAERSWKLPEGADADSGSFSTLAEIVLGGVRRGRVALGESVAIVGAGLLGQLCACFCRRAGAWPVIVIDPAQSRLETASRMGATHILGCPVETAGDAIRSITRERMVDVVFEITGHPLAFPPAVRLARRLGRVVLLGSPRGPVTIDLHDEVHSLGLEVIGAHNSAHPPVETPHNPWTISRHINLFLDWLAAGEVDVRPLITHHYAWQRAPDAYRMLLEDRTRALGVVIEWSRG